MIGPDGRLVGRYDKRRCSQSELAGWYTPGSVPCAIQIGQLRLGCAICLEVRFPELWDEYRRLGVHGVLLSTFNGGHESAHGARRDAILGITAQAHAVNNGIGLRW